ncbi:hypothetical protein CRM22_003131 [Opisthorchis felineus]|uniref:INTS8 TPR repeats domain-containing protein n=2 Tax=Opisthorchis felineus TaxID=147828 RepID=A0A4S2M2T4_OPIFE|nr:hypothetical protein CRM22_003131 [Opisthorchis felineus]
MMCMESHVSDSDKNWLYYLVRPTQLLVDVKSLSVAQQLSLLKQLLSQAEVADRRISGSARSDGLCENDGGPDRPHSSTLLFGTDGEPNTPYRKSKILNALSMQIAAGLKFNLNLFSVTYEIPVRLLARLYRILVTTTAKNSPVLQPLFDHAEDKENIFVVNPYARFTWNKLHPTTIYALVSYHIWCLQVSLVSSMLPQPFRNLTPIVAGLTEIPDLAFFTDNRVEVGVILGRSEESVSQLTQVLSQLDLLKFARPHPSAFPLVGPGLPPALGAPAYMDVDDATKHESDQVNSNISIRDAEVLSTEFISCSLNFVLGRYAFQKQHFEEAEEKFGAALSTMLEAQLTYTEEVGVTPSLLEVYLKACQSTKVDHPLPVTVPAGAYPSHFVQSFCVRLERSVLEQKEAGEPFWRESLNCSGLVESSYLKLLKPEDISAEDHLVQVLMEDVHSEDRGSKELIVPIDQSLRERLAQLCSLYTVSWSSRSMPSTLRPTKLPKLERALVTDEARKFESCQQLFTKVVVCNTVERLVSGFFTAPAQLTVLLFTAPATSSLSNDYNDEHSLPQIDPQLGRDFLLDCLACFLRVAINRSTCWARRQCEFVYQFITYLVQQGINWLGGGLTTQARESALSTMQFNFTGFLNALVSHCLFTLLPTDCQAFVQSLVGSPSSIFDDSKKDSVRRFGVDTNLWGLHGLARALEYRSSGSSEPGERRDVKWTSNDPPDSHFKSTLDIDMRNPNTSVFTNPPSATNRISSDRERDLFCDSTPTTHSSFEVSMLLASYSPSDVNTNVRRLLKSMPAWAILELNASWLPVLRQLVGLELFSGPSFTGILDENVIDILLTHEPHVATLLVAMVQLAMASVALQLQTTTELAHARSLLLAAMNGLASLTAVYCTPCHLGRITDAFQWLRAAVQHELFLSELLEVFLAPAHTTSVPNRDVQEGNTSSQNQSIRRYHWSDLSRRAKVCLYHAAGLHQNASELDNKMSATILFAVSPPLVIAAACFLLMNHEHYFLLPPAKHSKSSGSGLPKGPLSGRGPYSGPLGLIRALLRLHRTASSMNVSCSSSTDSACAIDVPGSSDSTRSSVTDWVNDSTSTPPSRSNPANRPQTHSLKTSINNLWNLVLFGCLVPELTEQQQQSQDVAGPTVFDGKTERSQIRIPILILIARMLASSARSVKPTSDSKWKGADLSSRANMSLNLLNHLLVCIAHITHAICPSFRLPQPPIPVDAIATYQSAAESRVAVNEAKSENHRPVEGGRKRSRWDPSPQTPSEPDKPALSVNSSAATSLLFNSMWPSDSPATAQLPNDAVHGVLYELLSCALACWPTRMDWLHLRAELEFVRKQYRAAISSYLEICAISTESFTRPLPGFVKNEEFIFRMVHSCLAIGLLGESVVLCQLCPDNGMIEFGLQLIAGMVDIPASDALSNANNDGNDAPAAHLHLHQELYQKHRARGACGGLLNPTPLDCLDSYADYIWDVRLLETLSTSALGQGALELHAKFNAFLSVPELNCNNPPHVLSETADARALEFLAMMAEKHMT